MRLGDKQIDFITLLLSLLLHAALFIQFSNTAVSSSQAQAPVRDTRISLNLLPPVKQKVQKVDDVKPLKQKKIAKKKLTKKKKIIQPKHEQAVAPKIKKDVKRQAIDDVSIQQRYLSMLLIHIEGNKYYPRAARLRGVEGSIQVSFLLHKDGKISGLSANGRSIVLRRAAKGAVNKSLPLPKCPEDVKCPIQVSYAMQYKIRKNN